MTIRELISRFSRIDLERAVVDAVESTEDQYLDMQRNQFAEGERADGSFLPPYSLQYAAVRRREGLQTEVKDLRRTGAFYEAMMLEAFPDEISITSDVDYERWISHHYNQDNRLYGLNEQNLAEYRDKFFLPALMMELREQTGLSWAV